MLREAACVPSSLTFEEHLALLKSSGDRLIEVVLGARKDAPVPTCPDWNAQALLAHQAMVHSWATAVVLGEVPNAVPDEDVLRTHTVLADYYHEGHASLLNPLREAPRTVTGCAR